MKKITLVLMSITSLTLAACSSSQIKTHHARTQEVNFDESEVSSIQVIEKEGMLQVVVVAPSKITAK